MNCVIVDDDPVSNGEVSKILANSGFIELKAVFTNALNASRYLAEYPAELIILNIAMPLMNGFQLLQTLPYKPLVIVHTASREHALRCFEIDAVDYLLKPAAPEKLFKALNKALWLKAPGGKTNFDAALKDATLIRANGKFYRFKYDDIILVEGQKDYVKVYTATESLMVALNITNFHSHLPPAKFIRVHRSYVINLNKITRIEKDHVFLDNHQAPIGKMYKDEFVRTCMSENFIKK